MRPSESTQLLDTVSNKKSRENTPEDETTTSLVEGYKQPSLGKEIAVLRGKYTVWRPTMKHNCQFRAPKPDSEYQFIREPRKSHH